MIILSLPNLPKMVGCRFSMSVCQLAVVGVVSYHMMERIVIVGFIAKEPCPQRMSNLDHG